VRYFVGVSCAFGAGSIVGVLVGIFMTEQSVREEYRESAASYRRAMEMASTPLLVGEVPVETEQEIAVVTGDIVDGGSPRENFDPMSSNYEPKSVNPYHRAVEAVETPVDMFVAGGVNDYGISYLEEEEYEEDDGRNKNQVDFTMDEDNTPYFWMDGKQMDDWDVQLGDSILVDFLRLVPTNIFPQVLYVRNHRTDEDYEVTRERP